MHLMPLVPARLFGTDGEEIGDLSSWLAHAPPEKGVAQWRDGYSAKEQAKGWLRSGSPAMPAELAQALLGLELGSFDEIFGRPEHQTRLDKFSRARQHDLFGCPRVDGMTVFVVGVEAKACEGFDGLVRQRAAAAPPSNKRARCNFLSRALFGRDVLDEESGGVLDEGLAGHGYQLWTAAVGTVIEAQRREVGHAVLVVQQFRPWDPASPPDPEDKRDWIGALERNAQQFEAFRAAVEEGGGRSFATDFVQDGTALHVLKVESILEMTPRLLPCSQGLTAAPAWTTSASRQQ